MPYKVTEADGTTHGGTQWGPGVRHEASGPPDQDLCTDGWIHYYEDRYVAALMNPIHGVFKRPTLWHFLPEGDRKHELLKSGCRAGTTTRRARLPSYTLNQQRAFGILCARACPGQRCPIWDRWADDWLSGRDRTAGAEEAAAEAAKAHPAAWVAVRAVGAWAAVEAVAVAEATGVAIDFPALARQAYNFERPRGRRAVAETGKEQ